MNTYPEMNEKIVGLLELADDPMHLYAAQRIKELEQQVAQFQHPVADASQTSGNGWVSVEDRLPENINGKDYSENVFAWCNNQLMVMCLALVPDDNNKMCYTWCNCDGKIDGDGEFDDNYYPTHWQPLPPNP